MTKADKHRHFGGRITKERRVDFTRNTLAIGAVGFVLGAAGQACADPAFDAFRQLCVATAGDYAAVLTAADTGAWKPVDVTVAPMNGVVVSDKATRGRTIAGGDATLSTWRGKTATNVTVSTCTVQVAKGDFSAARASTQAWAGFAPQETKDLKAIFRLSDVSGEHKAVTPSDYDAAAAGPGMEIITVTGGANGGVNLDLLKIKK